MIIDLKMRPNEEFWIMTCKGDPLFCYPPSTEFTFQDVTNLFTTIQLFASEIQIDEVQKQKDQVDFISFFSAGKFKYYFLKNDLYALFFIMKVEEDKKVKTKQMNKYLKMIQDLFIERFDDYLERIVNVDKKPHPSIFDTFKDDFDIFLKEKFKV